MILPSLSGKTTALCAEPFALSRLNSSSAKHCLAFPLSVQCIGAGVYPRAVVAKVGATFGMLFTQRLLHVHENDVWLDLAVLVVGGCAVASGAVHLHILIMYLEIAMSWVPLYT